MADTPKRGTRTNNKRTNNKRTNNKKPPFLVVGFGASAGGIKALETIFERMPADANMAFVVILHLSPEHESNLAAMLQRKTAMPVIQVQEQIAVQPNHVYVIPPIQHLAMEDGHIRLIEPEQQRGRRVPVDLFFRSLAEAYTTHAVGIVLSGTGTDGTIGLRRIKERGGVSIAQDPQEAEYDGMPRSVINAGLVDFVLSATDIPRKLVTLRQTTERLPNWPEGDQLPDEADAEAVRGVLAFLRARTNHDFSNYKRSTILRRIARRLQVNNIEEISHYLQFLRDHPSEAPELLKDLLISVTNFFRDAESFALLKEEITPRLFEGKELGDQVRVWVTGCATGEEAYSFAIMLLEYAETLEQPPSVQIFATDIDDEGIAHARDGVFPESIEADVSPERLRRFFHKEGHHYRVKKEVREAVLFAPHNVLRDPPFSKLDLVSCRNLLIYLNRETQERVLEIFHFALRPNGFLFLGASESAESLPDLYTSVDKKHRVYLRRPMIAPSPFLPEMPMSGRWEVRLPNVLTVEKKSVTYSELHHSLLEHFAPPSVLINKDYEIVHLSENAGRYLRFAGGEPSRNLLKVVHPDLRLDLRAALFAALQGKLESEVRNVRLKLDGENHLINILVRRIERPEAVRSFLLVIFEDASTITTSESAVEVPTQNESSEIEMVVRQLDDQLQRTKEQLRSTIEQYETSTEELKASNEELQAINEELRSTTEELETSKEELQSVNEELTTVNHELKEKVDEISRFNSDLTNLMASTDIGTIFLDRGLYLKRYTPRVQDLFNVIASDLDRPFIHLTHKLDYNDLAEDAEKVLQTLMRVEREVRSQDGRWYLARLLPYRTMEDRIDGVVLTFVDITERKNSEARLRANEEHLRMIVESTKDYAIFTLDMEGRIKTWSAGATHIFGFAESEAVGQLAEITFTAEDRKQQIPQLEIAKALAEGRAEDERWQLRKDGSRFFASGVMTPMRDHEAAGFVKVLRDLTAHKFSEEELRRSRDELESRVTERTAELEKANRALQKEIAERSAAQTQVQELLRRIVSAQELERQRIARDVHDIFGQQLTALRLKLESLKEWSKEQPALLDQLEQTQALARRLDTEVDFMAWELRPLTLDQLGMVAAFEGFIQDWSKHFGIATDFHTSGMVAVRLNPEIEINLYRIGQEALNNVYKHANASRVDIILEHRNPSVILVIEDNGKGFDTSEKLNLESGIGLLSMRERAALVGGTLEIESTPGKGTTVFARIPVQSAKRKGKP
ncbi:MAG: PAS domain S-box protein [Acidobacteria bacterium]|nr:PAS domain S-box protein [Acidobacteriota bacterium]